MFFASTFTILDTCSFAKVQQCHLCICSTGLLYRPVNPKLLHFAFQQSFKGKKLAVLLQ